MESNYKLLHKSYNTHLRTSLPVYFYGLPNGAIYLVYARFYEISFNNPGLEFVFAVLKNYHYDFESGQVADKNYDELSLAYFSNNIEANEFDIKIIKAYRNIYSFREAIQFLSSRAKETTQNLVAEKM